VKAGWPRALQASIFSVNHLSYGTRLGGKSLMPAERFWLPSKHRSNQAPARRGYPTLHRSSQPNGFRPPRGWQLKATGKPSLHTLPVFPGHTVICSCATRCGSSAGGLAGDPNTNPGPTSQTGGFFLAGHGAIDLGYHHWLKGRLSVATGTVKWFNPTKGYGFIQPDSGQGCLRAHLGRRKSGTEQPQ
jgi:hypothetical protein